MSNTTVKHTPGQAITRASVMNFWTRELNSGRRTYRDDSGEKEYTQMGEDAAAHFGILSEDGQSEIEMQMFDWAVEMIF
jgi:hypothetical protein